MDNVWRSFTIAVMIAFAVIGFLFLATSAPAHTDCPSGYKSYKDTKRILEKRYKEHVRIMMVKSPTEPPTARIMEFWGAKDGGSWTLLERDKNNCLRIIAAGPSHVFPKFVPNLPKA